MIKDKLQNAETYYSLSKNLQKGFEWLKEQPLATIKAGKYYIDDENIFANVQEYDTKESAKYETHSKYIDIQYMIKGKEFVGVCEKSECKTFTPYDSEKDLEFMDNLTPDFYEILNEGEFLVFYPQDAHKPSINPNEKLHVKKVIVKVAID
jgi:YhcH/YjgK/YiaL family protein